MATKDKATLRADILSMLPSNTTGLITPEKDRTLREDFVDSLLASESVQGGAGISVDRAGGVLTIVAGGSQASVGLPIFFGAATYSAANARITLNGVVAPPRPSIIYCIAPVDLDRAADDLTMLVDGVEYDLVDVVAGNVAARLLTPAGLVGVLWRSGEARMLEILDPRPQDFDIVATWVDGPRTPPPDLAAADVAAGTSYSVPDLVFPDYTGSETFAWLFFGVPTYAPPIAEVRNLRLNSVSSFGEITSTLQVGGVTYRWYRVSARTRPNNNLYRFTYGPYA